MSNETPRAEKSVSIFLLSLPTLEFCSRAHSIHTLCYTSPRIYDGLYVDGIDILLMKIEHIAKRLAGHLDDSANYINKKNKTSMRNTNIEI